MVAAGSDVIVGYDVFAQCTDTGTLAPMIRRTQTIVDGRLNTVHADKGYSSLLDLQDCQALDVELLAPVKQTAQHEVEGENLFTRKDFTFFPAEGRCQCPAGHEMQKRAEGVKPRADGRTVMEVRYEQSEECCGACPLAKKCLKPGSRRRSASRLVGQEMLDELEAKMETTVGQRSRKLRAQTVERLFADGKRNRKQNVQNGRGLARVKAEVGLLVIAQNILRLYNLIKRREKQPP
jgi:hypothetical protein